MKTITLEQGTPKWLKWRKSGIGGSDAAAVLNKSPYMTAFELYMDKINKSVKKDESGSEFIFQRGHETEKKIRKEVFDLTGRDMVPMCIQHSTHSFLLGSLDGYDSSLGILEAKLVGKDVLKEILSGIIPAHHSIQMQHNMMVSEDIDVTRYFAHDLGKKGAILEVKSDKEFQKILFEAESQFWDKVTNKIAPELTDEDFFIPEDPTDFKKIARIKLKLDRIQAEYDTLADKLKSSFTHPKVAFKNVKIITVTKTGSIDYAKIPEIKKLETSYLDSFRKASSSHKQIRIGG